MGKKEIWKRGPLACGIAVTDEFEEYSGGIYSQGGRHNINHIISVVGWGKEMRGSTGLEGTAGAHTGENWDTSAFRCIMTTWPLKRTACGQCQNLPNIFKPPTFNVQ